MPFSTLRAYDGRLAGFKSPVARLSAEALWVPATALLLAILCIVQISCALSESATGDEPIEIAAGYSYLKTGDFRMNPEHPPLVKMLQAAPLLRFGIARYDSPAWNEGDAYGFGMDLFRANERKVDSILFAARAVSIVLTLCLGLAIALWARARFGALTAIVALTLFVFDPTVNAHGHYAKNDIAVALFAFLACIAWQAVLALPSRRRVMLAGAALGLALATKFSALFLIPTLLVLLLFYARRRPHRSLWRRLGAFAAVVALACAVVVLAYWLPALWHGAKVGGVDVSTVRAIFDRSVAGARSRPGGGSFTAHPYAVGLTRFLDHSTTGHRSYLLGVFRTTGWWYYFPIAFLAKEPVSLIAFMVLAAGLALRMLRHRPLSPDSKWILLLVPPGVFSLFAFSSAIDIGIRHALPVWPWLLIAAPAAVLRARVRYATLAAALLTIGMAAESLWIFPHYLAFFNAAVGGPANGPNILLDSNIDWGQDAKGLGSWASAHSRQKLCLDYWGNNNLAKLGLKGPSLLEGGGIAHFDCAAAVSVNFLFGLSPERGDFSWLRRLPPQARIGYSIYVFDLPRLIAEHKVPLSLLPVSPAFTGVLHEGMRGTPTASDPVRPGEILAFYMTGLGPVSPPVPQDKPAPTTPLTHIIFPMKCRWDEASGGPEAEILFAGLAPGLTGVYQANIRVPAVQGGHELTCRCEEPGNKFRRVASIRLP